MFSGGTGTQSDPYWIVTLQDFKDIGTNLDKHFIQKNDIDLGGAFQPLGYNNGNSGLPFFGSYDGGGFAIKNGIINYPALNEVGIFRKADAIIKNILIQNVKVYGNQKVGCLVGYAYSSAAFFVENIHTDASCEVYCNGYDAGGIVGSCQNSGFSGRLMIAKCSNKATINNAGNNAGGIAGQAVYCNIQNCYNTGKIIGNSNAGGICGYLNGYSAQQSYQVNVDNCYNAGNIKTNSFGGGIIGTSSNAYAFVRRCFVTNISITRTSGTSTDFGRISGKDLANNSNNYASENCTFVI